MTSKGKPATLTRDDPHEDALFGTSDPFALFSDWMALAEAHEPNDPNAMSLATVDAEGAPDVRIVLLKGFDERGFVFYTNLEGAKGRQIIDNPVAALCLHWKSLRRQVRVRGPLERVSDDEADAYFASRGRMSRVGAWASLQSRPLDSRETLEARTAEMDERFRREHGEDHVPRPPHWTGSRILARTIEFWRDGANRLHDRRVFTRADTGWTSERLYP